MAIYPEWSDETEGLMRAAGWYPARRMAERVDHLKTLLSRTGGFELHESAVRALEEFVDLIVRATGEGRDRARGGFQLNPELALGEEDRFSSIGFETRGGLFPLGEAFDGHAFLAIDSTGRTFLVGDDLELLGDNVKSALDAILTGTVHGRRPVVR